PGALLRRVSLVGIGGGSGLRRSGGGSSLRGRRLRRSGLGGCSLGGRRRGRRRRGRGRLGRGAGAAGRQAQGHGQAEEKGGQTFHKGTTPFDFALPWQRGRALLPVCIV